eukprot:CAMPEP_0176412502 /NCGR_PEP_ID=MMETSP0127-20121128/4176_1 /TAXON_ID=938130 /ORGANISM="Platyophrya macrostoma, Strain WH" /LENGTH=741 /DNA_ID=CAMNT_0017792173 /DNA_START=179 /DNA_END=2404 /DNA_ORIENTATION=+
MPEGHAIVHFKPNIGGAKGNSRYQTKYITLSVEEASTKSKSQIGLVEFDVANCLQGQERAARVVKQADFRMSGFGATVTIQVVLHPQGENPPAASVSTTITPRTANRDTIPPIGAPPSSVSTAAQAQARGVGGVVEGSRKKVLNRDEAMTLLLSVEGILDQRGGISAAQHENERQSEASLAAEVQQLEERVAAMKMKLNAKRMLSEAASRMVHAETLDYVQAQFEKLEQTENSKKYLHDVEASLQPFYTVSPPTTSNTTELESRLRAETQELLALQRQQDRLGQLQLQRDVSDELVVTLQRVHEKEQSIASITAQLKSAAAAKSASSSDASWEAQRKSVLEELEAIETKTKSLTEFAEEGRRMIALRVEDWANRRFAPMRENDRALKESKAREEAEQKAKKQHDLQKQIVDLFGSLESEPVRAAAPMPSATAPAVAPSPVPSAAPPLPPPAVDLFVTVPKSSDFESIPAADAASNNQPKQNKEEVIQAVLAEEYAFGTGPDASVANRAAAPPAPHRDPFADLGRDMFAQISQSEMPAARKPASVSNTQPTESKVPAAADFASEAPSQNEAPTTAAVTATHSELRRAYVFGGPAAGTEDQTPSVSTNTFTAPSVTYDFGSQPAETSTSRSSSQHQQQQPSAASVTVAPFSASTEYSFGVAPPATGAPSTAPTYDFGGGASDGWATGFGEVTAGAATVSPALVSVGFTHHDSFFDSPADEHPVQQRPAAAEINTTSNGMYSFE